MLPGVSGIDILKEVRKNGLAAAVIMVTARDQLSDRVGGLDSGADDYLAKPFHMEELLARVRALGRRADLVRAEEPLRYGDLTLDARALSLRSRSDETSLTRKESQMLELLIACGGQAVSKEQIILKVWGYDSDAGDNAVERHVFQLRTKLDSIRASTGIRTLRGLGYKLEKREESHV